MPLWILMPVREQLGSPCWRRYPCPQEYLVVRAASAEAARSLAHFVCRSPEALDDRESPWYREDLVEVIPFSGTDFPQDGATEVLLPPSLQGSTSTGWTRISFEPHLWVKKTEGGGHIVSYALRRDGAAPAVPGHRILPGEYASLNEAAQAGYRFLVTAEPSSGEGPASASAERGASGSTAREEVRPGTRPEGAPGAENCVLVADNDELLRQAVGDFLRSRGFTVYQAEDGLEALQLASEIKPQWLILDIIMPKLSGAKVSQLLRQDPALGNTKIVVFSGIGALDFRWFPELRADAYVAKGVLADACENILKALQLVVKEKAPLVSDTLFGYGGDGAESVFGEVLVERQHLLDILNTLGHSLGKGLLELDEEGRIVQATTEACVMLGKKETEVIGQPFVSLSRPENRRALQELLAAAARTIDSGQSRLPVQLGQQTVLVDVAWMRRGNKTTGALVILEPKG